MTAILQQDHLDKATTSATTSAAERVRSLRLAKSMTLAELSRRSGLPISTLSKIENDKVSLSYARLQKLSIGLGVDISYLVTSDPAVLALSQSLGRRCHTKSDNASVIETADHIYRYHAIDFLNKKMTPMIIEIKSGPNDDIEFVRHAGEEYFLVLEGEVRFCCEFYAPVVMKAGESMYFDGSMGHTYQRNNGRKARILSICSSPYEELRMHLPPVLTNEEA